MHRVLVVLQAVALLAAGCRLVPAPAGRPALADAAPPATRKSPVVDRYHGVEVVDDYRWLENRDDPAVNAWSEAQNAYEFSIACPASTRSASR